jgi:hypothetical protein
MRCAAAWGDERDEEASVGSEGRRPEARRRCAEAAPAKLWATTRWSAVHGRGAGECTAKLHLKCCIVIRIEYFIDTVSMVYQK